MCFSHIPTKEQVSRALSYGTIAHYNLDRNKSCDTVYYEGSRTVTEALFFYGIFYCMLKRKEHRATAQNTFINKCSAQYDAGQLKNNHLLMWLINDCLHFLKDYFSHWWCMYAIKAYTVNKKIEVKYHLPKVFLVWLWPRTFAACHTTLSVVTCPHCICICIYTVRTVNKRQMQQKSSLKKQNANNTTNSWGKQMLIYIHICPKGDSFFHSHYIHTLYRGDEWRGCHTCYITFLA